MLYFITRNKKRLNEGKPKSMEEYAIIKRAGSLLICFILMVGLSGWNDGQNRVM